MDADTDINESSTDQLSHCICTFHGHSPDANGERRCESTGDIEPDGFCDECVDRCFD